MFGCVVIDDGPYSIAIMSTGLKSQDQTWVKVQKKTFSKWANSHLRRRYGAAQELIDIEKTEEYFEVCCFAGDVAAIQGVC